MRRSRALVTVHALPVLLFATGACSIDHRHLESSQEDGGKSSLGAHAGADGGALAAPGGTSAGGTGSSPGLVDGCADLNTDGIADCKTTLVKNASFSSDVGDWLAEPDVELVWQPRNALDDTMSGSARLGASSARARAAQCVEVRGKQLVIAYANAFVPSLADAVDSGHAELEVSFFETDDCSGDRAGFFETPGSTVVNSWAVVQAGGISLEVTRSVSLALVGLKPATGGAIEVYFDNVMLQAKEL